MSRLILIDGDFILWKVVPNRVLTETEVMYNISSEKTLEETLALMDWYLQEKIFKPTQATHYIGYLGGIGNFRKELTLDYKKGRTEERPNFFRETKRYLVDKYNFHLVDDMESEDAVGISLTKYPDSIIICEDHDLLQLESTQYNPTKKEWKTISKNEALYNFWRFMVEGCASDNVKGIINRRKNIVKKLIGEYDNFIFENFGYESSQKSLREVIQEEYISLYGEYKGIEQFALNYKLLRILREKEGFIVPEPNEVPSIKTEEVNLTDLKF